MSCGNECHCSLLHFLNINLKCQYIGWAKKAGPYFCQILTDLKKNFTGIFVSKFAVKKILKIPLHLAYVATLPCKTLLSAKQAINDKLQGSVVTYLKCGDGF